MIWLTPRPLAVSLVACAVLGLSARSASADDDAMTQCIAASDRGLDLRKQGKLMEARRILAACAAAACGPDISSVCQKRIVDINVAMPSIILLPKDGAGRDVVGVQVAVDGAPSGHTLDGRPIAVDPGTHVFRVLAPGQPPAERTFVIAEGAKDRREMIEVGPALPAPQGGAEAAGKEAPQASGSGRKTAAYVVGGVGLLAVAGGAVFGLLASSQWSTSKSDCATALQCNSYSNAVTAHNNAWTDATVADIAFAVGGVALVTAATLFFTAPTSPTTGFRVAPAVARDSAGLALTGSFQ